MKQYTGTLSRNKMPRQIARAYSSWRSQKERCRVGEGSYAGQRVHYGSRAFIAWWLNEFSKREHWTRPSVGRIDHSKGYFFGNIELVESSANTAERNSRYTVKIIAYHPKTEELKIFKSTKEAAIACKCAPNNIHKVCTLNGRKSLNGWRFYYAG